MDKCVESSIESRRTAIYDSYKIDNGLLRNRIDELFIKINKLGNDCKDVNEFETRFAESPLNTEYTSLLVEISSNNAEELDVYKPTLKDIAKQNLNQTKMDILRDSPIGIVMQVKQTFNLFKKHYK